MLADTSVGLGDVWVFLVAPLGLFVLLAACTWLVMGALRAVWDAALYVWWRHHAASVVQASAESAHLCTTDRPPPARPPAPINWRWAR